MTGERDTCAADILVLSQADIDLILRHLRQALPNEGVGLLGVERVAGEGIVVARARRFYPGSNIRASPTRYEMDAHEIIAALRDIDRRGWSLGAIVHSHPAGPATPSATDIAEFLYPEALLVIASFAAEPVGLRAWKLKPDGGTWRTVSVPILRRSDWMPALAIADSGDFRE